VGSEFLHELNTVCHLLPKLDEAINGAGNYEIGDRSNSHKGQLILVHEGLGVPCGGGQGVDIDLLKGELSALLLWRNFSWQSWAEVIVGGIIVTYTASRLAVRRRKVAELRAKRNPPFSSSWMAE
jgi:hypothetical protein